MGLQRYRKKRRFNRSPEPAGNENEAAPGSRYLIQKHAARRLHYDFRLELDGVLKSWAVPKGPSLDPAVKLLAVHVEDHPIEYASFEGVIPQGEYGGGTVMLWDHGTWQSDGDPVKAYEKGKLKFQLHGEKLQGHWNLVRMGGKASDGGKNWLLIKSHDDSAQSADDYDVLEDLPRSVASDRTMEQIAAAADCTWSPDGESASESPSAHVKSAEQMEPSSLQGARQRSLPESFQPQLASAGSRTPRGDEWLHELKFDGYRLLSRIEHDSPRLLTRKGNDWTDRFPTVAEAVARLGWNDAIVDGEVVVLAPDGTSDFQALQNLMKRGRSDDVVYYLFDLPFYDGYDFTASPLAERKRLLAQLLNRQPADGVVRYSDHITGHGKSVFVHTCRHALEGLVSKRASSTYVQRRSRNWVKSKCLKRQEFVVGGWTEPSGSRQGFGALLLGYYDDGRLVYCGKVGTGFNNQSLHDVRDELDGLEMQRSPFDNPPKGGDARGVHWVRPQLVAEVEFTAWTGDGNLRHPSFQGLREDKPADEVVREDAPAPRTNSRTSKKTAAGNGKNSTSKKKKAMSTQRQSASARRAPVAGVQLTNPDRVLYPEQGVTKLELAEFYEAIADWILPHIAGRPLTLVRCPKGRGEPCFYQKHLTESMPEPLRGVEIQEKNQPRIYLVVDDLSGLISLVQMSALELHPWPAREDRLDRPDRLVFDLDPGEGANWQAMIQAAHDVRQRLELVDLQSFLRTSGGKGLHVVVPLVRRTPWDDLKRFAKSVADDLAAEFPDRYLATASKARRSGKIFIDYLRNQRGATAVASYSTRARAGASVATPIRWEELDANMKPDKYTVKNLRHRLTSLGADPWKSFFQIKQSLSKQAARAGRMR